MKGHKPIKIGNKIPQFALKDQNGELLSINEWGYSPAGVPMSILTGRLAADKIIKRK